jgi:poly(A) polymerase
MQGEVLDYCGGLADLAARRIRFIGAPEARITEDYLRILRFFRFQAQYGAGEPDAAGLSACIALRAGLDGLSRERVQAELLKLLAAPGRNATVASLAGTGIWAHLTRGIARIGRLAGLGDNRDPVLALATLELAKTEDASRLADVLRLSNEAGRRLMAIAQALEALGNIADPVNSKTIRVLAFRHGREAVADAVQVTGLRFVPERDMLVEAARAVPDSPFRGAGVVAAGIPAGPRVGAVIRAAEEAWIAADFPVDGEAQAQILTRAIRASAP